jgi:hypothetical protein
MTLGFGLGRRRVVLNEPDGKAVRGEAVPRSNYRYLAVPEAAKDGQSLRRECEVFP